MKYYIYTSKNIFKDKDIILKIKKKITSNDPGSDLSIDFKLSNDPSLCYAFVKEKNEVNLSFTLKALLYL